MGLVLPATTVARWAPGGSVVVAVDDARCRLTIGDWSWSGVAGLLITCDAAMSEVEPAELRRALAAIADRLLDPQPPGAGPIA